MGITTKKGDGGFTYLPGTEKPGERVRKDDPRIEFFGTLDELDAFLALGEIALKSNGALHSADIIAETRKGLIHALAVKTAEIASHTAWLEQQIALLEKKHPVRDFARSWTSDAAAHLNAARSMCRRAERRWITAAEKNAAEISSSTTGCKAIDWESMYPWLNRLSDLLFLLAVSEEKGHAYSSS